jgi:hypothetical protein
MIPARASDYYLAHKSRLLKQHAKLMAFATDRLRARYGEATTGAIMLEVQQAFEDLIPAIPYIGGGANPFTGTLIRTASIVALYRVLQRRGACIEQTGELVSQMAELWVRRYPAVVRKLIGRLYMSRWWRRRMCKQALASQSHRYRGDFVYEVVEGDGTEFDWGIDYLECGIVKFCHVQGADELAPYLCRMDELLFPALGITLQRRGTLAQGCPRCDFRFRCGGQASTPLSTGA